MNEQQDMANEQIWETALDDLKLRMSRAIFNSWLADAQLVESSQSLFTIAVRSIYAVDWLQQRLGHTISTAVYTVAQREIEIRFVVKASKDDEVEGRLNDVGDSAETATGQPMTDYRFHGFYAPKTHWTQVPHYLTDDVPCNIRAVTFKLIIIIWRQTWGVVNARGVRKEEWLTNVSALAALTGLSLNSIKTAISEARKKGLVIQRDANSSKERRQYEKRNGTKLHHLTKLIGLRPRWDDEPIDGE